MTYFEDFIPWFGEWFPTYFSGYFREVSTKDLIARQLLSSYIHEIKDQTAYKRFLTKTGNTWIYPNEHQFFETYKEGMVCKFITHPTVDFKENKTITETTTNIKFDNINIHIDGFPCVYLKPCGGIVDIENIALKRDYAYTAVLIKNTVEKSESLGNQDTEEIYKYYWLIIDPNITDLLLQFVTEVYTNYIACRNAGLEEYNQAIQNAFNSFNIQLPTILQNLIDSINATFNKVIDDINKQTQESVQKIKDQEANWKP